MAFLAGLLALIVGGVGIANVMSISVIQRSSEIGIRRAVGHSRSKIAGQFLLESLFVGFLGGLVGAALGVGIVYGVSAIAGWVVVIDYGAIPIWMGLALVVAVVAGLFPPSRRRDSNRSRRCGWADRASASVQGMDVPVDPPVNEPDLRLRSPRSHRYWLRPRSHFRSRSTPGLSEYRRRLILARFPQPHRLASDLMLTTPIRIRPKTGKPGPPPRSRLGSTVHSRSGRR